MPPVAAAASAAWAAFQATAVGSFLTTTFVGRLLTTVAASALARALQPKPRAPGIRTEVTQTGGVNPLSFVLGTYATGGVAACPPMSHGKSGKTPNAYLTQVIILSAVKGPTLKSVILDGEEVTLGSTPHPDYGLPVEGKFQDYAWIKFYDGSQTTADPMLLAKYGSYPERPWSSDMTLEGLSYAIVTTRYKRKLFSSIPSVRFVLGGIPLYDPRKDDTVGGTGPHRWSDPATWEPSENPIVQIYNVARGISLPGGSVWGGGIDGADFDLPALMAAANACDAMAPDGQGGTEPSYRAGFEVQVADEPKAVIEELKKACAGALIDTGVTWAARAGGPGLPVYAVADDDILISDPETADPFPGLEEVFNGVQITYPDPDQLWEQKAAPPRLDATYEAEDLGRRKMAQVSMPAVPFGAQVQRLSYSLLREERRFGRLTFALGPEAAHLDPGDVVSVTHEELGFDATPFEIAEVREDLRTGRRTLSLHQRDPGDWSVPPAEVLPLPPSSTSVVDVPPQLASGWSATGISLLDGLGRTRRAGARLNWDGSEQDDVEAVVWRIRLASSGQVVISGRAVDVARGEVEVWEGLLPGEAYEAEMTFDVAGDRPAPSSGWLSFTAPDTRLSGPDIADDAVALSQLAQDARDSINQALADASTAQQLAVDTETTAIELASEAGGGVIQNAFDTGLWSTPGSPPRVTYVANKRHPVGQTAIVDIASTDAPQIILDTNSTSIWVGLTGAEAYRLEVDLDLVSGSMEKDVWRLEWYNDAAQVWATNIFPSVEILSEITRTGRHRFSFILKRPDAYTGNWTRHRLLYIANWGPSPGTAQAKNLEIHSVQLYPLTVSEAAVEEQKVALADIEGNLAAGYMMRAKAGTAGAELELVAADSVEGGPVSSARISADEIILDGSITAQKITVGTLVKDLFANGVLTVTLEPIDVEVFYDGNPPPASFQFKHPGLVEIYCIGGGGGGGNASGERAHLAGAGGGGGGLVRKFLPDVNTTDTYTLTLGAGGAGGAPISAINNGWDSRNGSPGGTTSFVGPGLNLVAGGGGGGQGYASGSTDGTALGGAGGTASGGDYNYPGGRGGNATQTGDGQSTTCGGSINFNLTEGTPDAADAATNENLTTSDFDGEPIPIKIREMKVAPFPLMYFGGVNFTGGQGAVGQPANGTNGSYGGGGGGATSYDSTDGRETLSSGGDGGSGIIAIFYHGLDDLVQ